MKENQEKKSLDALIGSIKGRKDALWGSGVNGAQMAYGASRIYRELRIPMLIVAPTEKAARGFEADMLFFLEPKAASDGRSLFFPSYHAAPSQQVFYHNETAARRVGALYKMIEGDRPSITITDAEGVLRRVIPKAELSRSPDLLLAGEEIDRDDLIRRLVFNGYTRAAMAEEYGDFSVRGGVIDIFAPLYPEPLRLELFGDTVDSIRFFSPQTQRTLRETKEAVVLPARETMIERDRLDGIVDRIQRYAHTQGIPAAGARDLVAKIREEGHFPGIEGLLPLIYPAPDTLMNYLHPEGLVLLLEPQETAREAEALWERLEEGHRIALEEERICARPEDLYLTWEEALAQMEQSHPLYMGGIPLTRPAEQPPVSFPFSVRDNTETRMALKSRKEGESPIQPLLEWIRNHREENYAVTIAGGRLADRVRTLLEPYGFHPGVAEHYSDIKKGRGRVMVLPDSLSAGFVWEDEGLAVITEMEIFGERQRVRKRRRKSTSGQKADQGLTDLDDLKESDLVVHADHGIGRYEGLTRLELDSRADDFLQIAYRDNDKLYLPVDRMRMLSKYMGMGDFEPDLEKLGGKSWERTKEKVKKSVERIAGDLLKLYAARRVEKGVEFEISDSEMKTFEAEFPYEETGDQQKAIEAVLADMASERPMDRLICGDVGYGKTEVAMRAAFVAVMGGKQVAVLVPTTVLAEQHFSTFAERFADYPIVVERLSRFRSPKDQRAVISAMGKGKVDIVIGTHRLLQKDIGFKDLGLMVLDEEQRFGVRHKERLKEMRKNVDVLTLTATPIPRTLHMSLTGIRDISIISTPPEDRRAIVTYVCELEDRLIIDAIRRELRRGGQSFFVHNNVSTIEAMAAHIKTLIPQVRLDIAHGQMDENTLEKVMLKFMRGEIDLLVTTTIIESGLDIPAANTILINRADRLGLAQIYQLRGRVGRSDEQAYAYLFIPSETTLSKTAQKRLKVLMEHSDLGSGFQIAMSDLKIRGGGSLLGASQSGHIAAVGYDMFLKLMESAIAEAKGEPIQEDLEPEIRIYLSAYLPESYIPDIDQRLWAYRKLTRMTDLKEIADYKAELKDRFGALPPEAANLLLKIMLRVLAIRAGVRRLDLTENQLQLYFSEAHQKNPYGIIDMVTGNGGRYFISPDQSFRADLTHSGNGPESGSGKRKGGKSGTGSPLVQTKNILKEIYQRVNG